MLWTVPWPNALIFFVRVEYTAHMTAAATASKSPVGLRDKAVSLPKLIRLMPAMASRNPAKNLKRGLSPPRNIQPRIAVKKGAMEMITPTLDARV